MTPIVIEGVLSYRSTSAKASYLKSLPAGLIAPTIAGFHRTWSGGQVTYIHTNPPHLSFLIFYITPFQLNNLSA